MKKALVVIIIICAVSCKPHPKPLVQPNTLSASEKIYGLSKIWQEVSYNFVYLDRLTFNWDSTYKAYIPKVIETKNDYEYYRQLQKFCALLKDGHTGVALPASISKMLTSVSFGNYLIQLRNYNNRAIVVNTANSKQDELPIGSEVMEVNGMPTLDYLKANVLPYISSSVEAVRLNRGIPRLLEGVVGDKVSIKYKTPKGEVRSVELTRQRSSERWLVDSDNKTTSEFHWMAPGVAYVKLPTFSDTAILAQFKSYYSKFLRNSKALIIDIRNNGGGSSDISEPIARLIMKSDNYAWNTASRKNIAYYKAMGMYVNARDTLISTNVRDVYLCYHNKLWDSGTNVRRNNIPNSNRLTYPIAILTNSGTASAAEDFLVFLDKEQYIVRIGTNTFGSTGMPLSITLPGGGMARICTIKRKYSDGREFVGIGIKPDIYVETTVKDLVNNNDPVLNKAVEYLTAKINKQ